MKLANFKLTEAPCPCGNRNLAADACCFQGYKVPLGDLLVKPAKFARDTPECMARHIDQCGYHDPKNPNLVSEEHYFSKTILKQLDGATITLLPPSRFSRTEVKSILAVDLCAPILCQHHNRQLGPLDTAAFKLFLFAEEAAADEPGATLALTSGLDIERWLLKVMLGMNLSGDNPDGLELDGKPRNTRVEVDDALKSGLEALYRGTPLGEKQGLYVGAPKGEPLVRADRGRPVQFWPWWVTERLPTPETPGIKSLGGFTVMLRGLPLTLVLHTKLLEQLDDPAYRPRRLVVRRPDGDRTILLSWPPGTPGAEGDTITLVPEIRPRPSGPWRCPEPAMSILPGLGHVRHQIVDDLVRLEGT